MMQLKKDYYALPEAAERSGCAIGDFLWLAEHRQIMLSVEAHHWPIVWGDEREFPGEPPIEIEDTSKPPFPYWNSGYLNLFWYDIPSLRMNGKLSLTEVYAEKDGREFIGGIQRGTTAFRGKQHECELEIKNVFISHEELQRVINGEAGDWESSASTPLETRLPAPTDQLDRGQGVNATIEAQPLTHREKKKDATKKRDEWIRQRNRELQEQRPHLKVEEKAKQIADEYNQDHPEVEDISTERVQRVFYP